MNTTANKAKEIVAVIDRVIVNKLGLTSDTQRFGTKGDIEDDFIFLESATGNKQTDILFAELWVKALRSLDVNIEFHEGRNFTFPTNELLEKYSFSQMYDAINS